MYRSSLDDNSSNGVIDSKKLVSLDRFDAVRAHVEVAFKSDRGDLALIGWIFDPESRVRGVSILLPKPEGILKRPGSTHRPLAHQVDGVQLIRVSRPDVVHAMAAEGEAGDDRHGLVLVVPAFPADGRLALALHDGRFVSIPFVAWNDAEKFKQGLKACWPHSGTALSVALKAAFGGDDPLTRMVEPSVVKEPGASESAGTDQKVSKVKPQEPLVQFFIDGALALDSGLVLIGWSTAGDGGEIAVGPSDGDWKAESRFRDGEQGLRLIRTFRPDLRAALPPGVFGDGLHGFVLYWPLEHKAPETLAVSFGGNPRVQEEIQVSPLSQNFSFPLALWIHAGEALKTIASQLPEEFSISSFLEEIEAERASEDIAPFAACDQALLLNNRVLILSGWIAKQGEELERVELAAGRLVRDISPGIGRYPRPDLVPTFPWSSDEALGFLTVVDDPAVLSCSISLKVVCRNGQVQRIRPQVQVMDWAALGKFLQFHVALAEPLLKQLAAAWGLADDAGRLQERIGSLRQRIFSARYQYLTTMAEHPHTVVAAIDRAYPLGEAGLLIFGWRFFPKHPPAAVMVRSAEGGSVEITDRMSALARMDVVQNFRPRFPQVNEWCGFVCLAPLPTRPGEARAICFDFGDLGEVWLKVPTRGSDKFGVELIKEILTVIPAPDKLRGVMFEIFDNGLGTAIEAVNSRRYRFKGPVEERQFGPPPQAPDVSVIVPLYGRYDFLRHQLAHFADDRDFDTADLIYVVDDPTIIAPTLDTAAAYHQLFGKPFRVIHYGQNLGFAGANNVGVQAARGETILLLNSDVIPKRSGWIATLRRALDTLPQAGAVGPLLLFSDDSIQHAGMRPKLDPFFPGFLLNTHPGKGQTWKGPDDPKEQPLLTAACLMLRKQDYLDLGGLDEGYVIGDFEDSDLCLALRRQGKRLWLVPEAKLWHLERQSQNLEGMTGYRQLLTLFNGWRYKKKIEAGLIADPNLLEA